MRGIALFIFVFVFLGFVSIEGQISQDLLGESRDLQRAEYLKEKEVKEVLFTTVIDNNGNIFIQKTIINDLMPATVTVWLQVKEVSARKGIYHLSFSLDGHNGEKKRIVKIDYGHIPSNPDQYVPKYGFIVGNFNLLKGVYIGRIKSLSPNSQIKDIKITIIGKATWPARKEL